MRIHYYLENNSIDDFEIEPCEPFLFNVYPRHYGFVSNHLDHTLTKGKIINSLQVIQQRKKEGLKEYQIKSLSQNFINKVEKLGITKEDLIDIIKDTYKDPLLKGLDNVTDTSEEQHNTKKTTFTVSY